VQKPLAFLIFLGKNAPLFNYSMASVQPGRQEIAIVAQMFNHEVRLTLHNYKGGHESSIMSRVSNLPTYDHRPVANYQQCLN
jgi:hypothetical protein